MIEQRRQIADVGGQVARRRSRAQELAAKIAEDDPVALSHAGRDRLPTGVGHEPAIQQQQRLAFAFDPVSQEIVARHLFDSSRRSRSSPLTTLP